MFLLVLLIMSMSIDISLQSTRVMEFRAVTTCTYKNPENPIGLSPVGYDVDVISVEFWNIFKETKCNIYKTLIKKVIPKSAIQGGWKGSVEKNRARRGEKGVHV